MDSLCPSRDSCVLANKLFLVYKPGELNVSKFFLRWKLTDFWCNYHVNVNSILYYSPGVILSFSVYTFILYKLFLNEKWYLFSGQ